MKKRGKLVRGASLMGGGVQTFALRKLNNPPSIRYWAFWRRGESPVQQNVVFWDVGGGDCAKTRSSSSTEFVSISSHRAATTDCKEHRLPDKKKERSFRGWGAKKKGGIAISFEE